MKETFRDRKKLPILKHTLSIGLMHHVQSLSKHRVQVAVHIGLYAMLTQLAIDSEWTGPVDLAPKGHIRVENGAEGVMPICQEHRAAPICPNIQEHRHCQSCQVIADTHHAQMHLPGDLMCSLVKPFP